MYICTSTYTCTCSYIQLALFIYIYTYIHTYTYAHVSHIHAQVIYNVGCILPWLTELIRCFGLISYDVVQAKGSEGLSVCVTATLRHVTVMILMTVVSSSTRSLSCVISADSPRFPETLRQDPHNSGFQMRDISWSWCHECRPSRARNPQQSLTSKWSQLLRN